MGVYGRGVAGQLLRSQLVEDENDMMKAVRVSIIFCFFFLRCGGGGSTKRKGGCDSVRRKRTIFSKTEIRRGKSNQKS